MVCELQCCVVWMMLKTIRVFKEVTLAGTGYDLRMLFATIRILLKTAVQRSLSNRHWVKSPDVV